MPKVDFNIILKKDGEIYKKKVTGHLMLLPIAGEKIRCVAHGGTLSHYESGYQIGDLLKYRVREKDAAKNDHEAAQMLIDDLQDRYTKQHILKCIDAQSTINE